MFYLYQLKQSEVNQELRYSLRTLEVNAPDGTVAVVGGVPEFLQNVSFEWTYQPARDKRVNAWNNLKVGINLCEGETVMMNDDFYFMKKIEAVPVFHRGTLTDMLNEYSGVDSKYVDCIKRAIDKFGPNALSYDTHFPLPVDAKLLRSVIKMIDGHDPDPTRVLWRTWYGNIFEIGGEYHADQKAYSEDWMPEEDFPFASSMDSTWRRGALGNYLRKTYPIKSKYEK